jgi:hypothetical protein
VGGYFSDTLEGGWMGDNLEFFCKILDLFLVFVYFIIIPFIYMHEGLH